MRWTLALICAALLLAAPSLLAQPADPADNFLNAYMSVQQAEKLERDGQLDPALKKYRFAASLLDQVSSQSPNWQPVIIEYRKKKTAESVSRLEEKIQAQSAPAVVEEPPLPTLTEEERRGPAASDSATNELRERLREMEKELKASREQLRNTLHEKETLADKLDGALKQIDHSKVSEAELRSRLTQTEDALKNAKADVGTASPDAKPLQDEIARLRESLNNALAERDAADDESAEFQRRESKAKELVENLNKERDDAAARAKNLEAQYADAKKTAEQLEKAQQEIAALKTGAAGSQQESERLNAQLAEAKKQVESLAKQRDEAAKQSEDLSAKIADAQKQAADATTSRNEMAKQRDAAREEVATLTKDRDQLAQERDTLTKDRDQLASQRDTLTKELDDVRTQLTKAKDAQKQVDKLIADNVSLTQKLANAEITIQQFNASAPEKDKLIISLRKQIADVQQQLSTTQEQSQQFQTTATDLQSKLDTASAELARAKAAAPSSEETRRLTDENDLLRGIVMRQLKEQARRDQARKLILTELDKMEVKSTALLDQIDYLGQPVVKLSEKERALFKDPQIEIAATDDSATAISIAAGKTGATPAEGTSLVKNAVTTPAPGQPSDEMPAKGPAQQPPGGETSPTVETTIAPNLPEELMPVAKDAKEAFDRGQYRESETMYLKILSQQPKNVYALSNLGVVRFRAGKYKLAEESFKKAIAIEPRDSFSQCTLGIVYYQQARYDDAVTVLTKAIQLNPKYAVAHNYLGITASQKGWQEAALKELESAIRLDPNYADAHFNLAVVLVTKQPPDKEGARKNYQRAIELGAESDTALEQMLK